jgi:8-oxo-dGTP pyrophosphatase MutT (NUDIX family)
MTAADLVAALRRAVSPAPEQPAAPPQGKREAAVLLLADPSATGLPLLFVRRTDHLRFHAGQIGFPGGSREPGDADLVATALRESEEEIGLDPANVEVLGFLPPRLTRRSDLWLTPVVGLRREPFAVRGDGYEVAEWFWVPLATLRDAPHRVEEVRTVGEEAQRVHFFDAEGRMIWGVTGQIVADLLDRLPAT